MIESTPIFIENVLEQTYRTKSLFRASKKIFLAQKSIFQNNVFF